METDNSDEDSANSIPRPTYEAISAIDSPQNMPLPTDGNDMEPLHNKRLKYVVSAPPTTNGSSSSSLSTMPATAAAGSGHSLTMKLTKVTRLPGEHAGELKPANTSTPKPEGKVRVPKEMIALKKSHVQSKVLAGFVNDVFKLKRRKSRGAALHASKQLTEDGLSKSLSTTQLSPSRHKTTHVKMPLKRSKSIPAPNWDSDEEWLHGGDFVRVKEAKTRKDRLFSVAYDGAKRIEYMADEAELSADGSNSNQRSHRSRSKTVSLSNEERQPRRSNLRSENEEFAKKHSAFLDRIINDPMDYSLDLDAGEEQERATETTDPEQVSSDWRTSSTADTDANTSVLSDASEPKKSIKHSAQPLILAEKVEQRLSEVWQAPPREGWDPFCWKCRQCGKLVPCSKCLRSFHTFCVRPASTKFDGSWKCPECVLIESAPKRPRRNDVSVELLSQLLAFALERMKHMRGAYKLRSPEEVLPQTFGKYFVNPVGFASLSQRIKNRAFHSVDEFLSEVKWMQHNALILDGGDIKVEQASKAVVKICRQEANEIDTCAECYLNANSSDEWFVKVCTQPHLLLWAKLKGFPYWPAKAMSFGPNSLVNVRFFGKHDRANVPIKDCFLYSAQDPNTQTSRRSARDLAECIKEVEVHIEQIKSKIGCFQYAAYRTPYDPMEEQQQLERMMPGVHDCIKRQLAPANKTPLQFLIRKTAGDKLSIVKKTKATESGNESDQSGSPSKQPKPLDAPEAPKEHTKPHSSNYEVIPKLDDPHSESRSCTVILKRKSLEACKLSSKRQSPDTPAATTKRKHSLSDASASSETSQQGGEHRRRPKHARKQLKPPEQEPEGQEESAAVAAPAEVVSVVELVRRRQGVTITKIPREQQQQAQPSEPANGPPEQSEAAAATAPAKVAVEGKANVNQRERQQQQLISRVVPFVEIKTEVLSEPEDGDEAVAATKTSEANSSPLLVTESSPNATAAVNDEATEPETTSAAPTLAPAPPEEPASNVSTAAPASIQIKEEIISDDEGEGHSEVSMAPPPPPPPLPSTTEHVSLSPSSATPAADSFVRYVGDTTIQRLSIKQGPTASKTPEPTAKRGGLRGIPHGPLPEAAQSQTPAPLPVAPVRLPTPNRSALNEAAAQTGAKIQAPKATVSNLQVNPLLQQLNVKSNNTPPPTAPSTASLLPPSTTSSLLKSNPSYMTVIPVDVAHAQHLPRSANGSSGGTSSAANLAIPVPPLTAVSKSTLLSSSAAGNVPVLLLPSNNIPPPPLAGLSQLSTIISTEASATNGVAGENVVAPPPPPPPPPPLLQSTAAASDAPPAELMTPGVAAAMSEILLRDGPPTLVARPRGPLQSDGSSIYPSQAGPVSQRLKENAHKITDYFISVIEDTLCDLATGDQGLLQARITGLTLENERLKQHYERQLTDIQRSTDLMIGEMRKTLENENKRIVSELRQQSMLERMRAVEEAKKKQWCANCMREAQLYCCWNTSYCDYPCQQMHWPRHSATCGQAANLQAQTQTQPSTPTQTQQLQTEAIRGGKQKSTPVASNNQYQKATAVSSIAAAAAAAGKKWPQPMMSVLSPTTSAEVLKLPTNTYLRPVSVMPVTSVTMSNNIATSATLITPSNHHASPLMAGQRSAVGYAAKPAPVGSLPVQRYNIPLPITVMGATQTYGLISEPQPKPASKPAARNAAKNNSRNARNANNAQTLRQNQHNPVFQQ